MFTKRNDRRRRHRKTMKDDFMVLRGQISDLFAASMAHDLDAADDKRWLAAHPQADARHRLPPGCTVVVQRGPMGTQIRMFYPPQK